MVMHKLSETKSGDYLLIGPYDEELIAKIHAMPSASRKWSPSLKAWRIQVSGIDQARRIIEDHYLHPDGVERQMMDRIRVLESTVTALGKVINRMSADLYGGAT